MFEPFPEHRGYQLQHWGYVVEGKKWSAHGKDGTKWFEADDEDELKGMIDAATEEIPEPLVY